MLDAVPNGQKSACPAYTTNNKTKLFTNTKNMLPNINGDKGRCVLLIIVKETCFGSVTRVPLLPLRCTGIIYISLLQILL